jgi:hypothetical protein
MSAVVSVGSSSYESMKQSATMSCDFENPVFSLSFPVSIRGHGESPLSSIMVKLCLAWPQL